MRSRDNEEKLVVGTIIVPSNRSVTIQDVVITNLTDEELEFLVKVNKKLRELAVSKIR